jgi:hypothetical protein
LPQDEPGLLSDLYLSGEYLLLHPRRNAFDYAVLSPNMREAPGGSIQSLDWDTRSGFRVGAGYMLPDQPWLISLTYTYLHSSDEASATAPPGGALFATLSRGGGLDDVTTAHGSTNLDFNVIDLEAARIIEVAPHLDVKLFGGGRFAWIDQRLSAIYNGGSSGAVNEQVQSPVYFHGAGVSVGGQAFWKIYRGLGIYGRARGSLLSGQFRNFLTETNNNGAVSIVNVRETYYQIVPVLETGLGIGWQGEHVSVSIGYELDNWFNMVNSPDFPGSSNIGKVERRTSDLSLEGLSVQLGLLF